MRLNWSKFLCIRPSSIDISEFKTKVNFRVRKFKAARGYIEQAELGALFDSRRKHYYCNSNGKNAYEQCNTFSLLSLQPRLIFVVKYWRFNSTPLIRHRVTPNSRLWWNMKTTAHTSFVLQMQSLRQSTRAKVSHSLVSNFHELTAEPRF